MIAINGNIIEQNHFPDKSLLVKHNPLNQGINDIEWKYESDAEIFTLYCLKRHLDDAYIGGRTRLIMQYIPHARQDRRKRDEDVFTLKYFSEIINSLKFDEVDVLDPHSPVSEALINNIVVDTAEDYIKQIIDDGYDDEEEFVIFYPDNGAYKKYTDFIKAPSCYGVKNRDWETGKIIGLDVITNGIDLKGKRILMIDDIISYGGSMYYSAKKLKELGCGDIYIYASHIENSILEGDLIKSGLFKKIYTTNSLFSREHELIKIL
jgi:ribose-phosphate pyrophosphokinase